MAAYPDQPAPPVLSGASPKRKSPKRNLALDFIKVKLDGLVLEVRGGEFNKVEYRGTATGITILNPTPAPGNPGKS